MTTLAEKAHMNRVKEMACAVCGQPGPSDAHHIRTGQGMSQRAGNFLVIPLCKGCHQGKNGIHGDRAMWKIRKLTELDALDETLSRIL